MVAGLFSFKPDVSDAEGNNARESYSEALGMLIANCCNTSPMATSTKCTLTGSEYNEFSIWLQNHAELEALIGPPNLIIDGTASMEDVGAIRSATQKSTVVFETLEVSNACCTLKRQCE